MGDLRSLEKALNLASSSILCITGVALLGRPLNLAVRRCLIILNHPFVSAVLGLVIPAPLCRDPEEVPGLGPI
jgi:hypothetical protein